ncbi:unnamed protein product, partial [Aphanomyces euteiches]
FGNPDVAEDFEYLYKDSPIHNVASFEAKSVGLDNDHSGFPAFLLTMGDHDGRVAPLHSLKLKAEVQHKLGSHPDLKNPLLIRIETKAGHGAGKPTSKVLQEAADIYAYMGWALGAKLCVLLIVLEISSQSMIINHGNTLQWRTKEITSTPERGMI